MNTATTFSSGFVTCLAAVSIACGGGGSDPDELLNDADSVCMAASVAEATTLIAAHGPLQCRRWVIGGNVVDGAAYPDFLIGADI